MRLQANALTPKPPVVGIPSEVGRLASLRVLEVAYSELEAVPPCLHSLTALQALSLEVRCEGWVGLGGRWGGGVVGCVVWCVCVFVRRSPCKGGGAAWPRTLVALRPCPGRGLSCRVELPAHFAARPALAARRQQRRTPFAA